MGLSHFLYVLEQITELLPPPLETEIKQLLPSTGVRHKSLFLIEHVGILGKVLF